MVSKSTYGVTAELVSARSPYRHASVTCLSVKFAVVKMESEKLDCPRCWRDEGYELDAEPASWEVA